MNVPKVSVIITTCNRRGLVGRAVSSVLNQDYRNFDLHIVDDGSEDNTPKALESIVDANDCVSYWRHDKRRGLSAARNTGISRSRGGYIAFLDDDDEWKPESLKRRIELLENLSPEEVASLGVIYTGCEIWREESSRVCLNMPKLKGNIHQAIIRSDIFTIPSTCLFSRKALERVGGFDEGLFSSVDHDIWMSLAQHGYAAYAVDEPLTITYQTKNHKCMTAETSSRIQGVEQFLSKWEKVVEQWFGVEEGKKYLKHYRRRVLIRLAAVKIAGGEWYQAYRLFCHVISKNHCPPVEIAFLVRIISVDFVKKCMPSGLLHRFRSMRK